jgi:hypothetical protein
MNSKQDKLMCHPIRKPSSSNGYERWPSLVLSPKTVCMITGIKKDQHVFTDYGYVPLVFAASKLVGFSDNKVSEMVCRAMSLTVLSYGLATMLNGALLK